MSKTNNLEVAKRLAAITGRDLEEFYNGTLDKGDGKNSSNTQVIQHVSEVRNSKETSELDGQIKHYLQQYGGEVVKGKIHKARQMTRQEYLKAKKQIKTIEDFWNSPLLYLMFRSEGQNTVSFVEWTTKMEKELE